MANTNNNHGTVANLVQAGSYHVHYHASNDKIEHIQGPARSVKRHANLPPRNPNFIGRSQLLTTLKAWLQNTSFLTVRGLGRIGKSELALEYAHREHGTTYAIAWWVRATSPKSLVEDLASLASSLGATNQQDPEQAANSALQMLDERSDWLLIYDNAQSLDQISHALPRNTGNLIITSANKSGWSRVSHPVDLTTLDRNESVSLITQRGKSDQPEEANSLSAELGDLPLALAQAASYIDLRETSVSRYRELYSAAHIEMLERGLESFEYPNSVATTWLIHINSLNRTCPEALDLLKLCAFLGDDLIPLDTILSDSAIVPYSIASSTTNQARRDKLVADLMCTHLVFAAGSSNVNMHRLVRIVTRHQLSTDECMQWSVRAATIVCLLLTEAVDTESEEVKLLLRHADLVANDLNNYASNEGGLGKLVKALSLILKSRATNNKIRELAQDSRQDWERTKAASSMESMLQAANQLDGMMTSEEAAPLVGLIVARIYFFLGEHSKHYSLIERAQEVARGRLPENNRIAIGLRELLSGLQ